MLSLLVSFDATKKVWVVRGRPFAGVFSSATIRPINPDNFLVVYDADLSPGDNYKNYFVVETKHLGAYSNEPGFSYTKVMVMLDDVDIHVG